MLSEYTRKMMEQYGFTKEDCAEILKTQSMIVIAFQKSITKNFMYVEMRRADKSLHVNVNGVYCA